MRLLLLGVGWVAVFAPVLAQDPGAAQDAEAAREKLLKAADELENIQASSEATRLAVDGMKADLNALHQNDDKLAADNASLRQQLTDLQTEFSAYKAQQAKERQSLIDSVAGLVAAGSTHSARHKKDAVDAGSESTEPPHAPIVASSTQTAPNLSPPPDNASVPDSGPVKLPPAKPQKGYYHVVAEGETVPMIVEAYRDSGVEVTGAQVRKANGLTADSVLKPGQKLFIPKPGT
jgi:regulator of replication initiation timing